MALSDICRGPHMLPKGLNLKSRGIQDSEPDPPPRHFSVAHSNYIECITAYFLNGKISNNTCLCKHC